MKKLKSKKALNPVVVSIILIVVTVIVISCMAALTSNFMEKDSLEIGIGFLEGNKYILIVLRNKDTQNITIKEIWINETNKPNTGVTIDNNGQVAFLVPQEWIEGKVYEIKVVTSTGKQLYYVATAPTTTILMSRILISIEPYRRK